MIYVYYIYIYIVHNATIKDEIDAWISWMFLLLYHFRFAAFRIVLGFSGANINQVTDPGPWSHRKMQGVALMRSWLLLRAGYQPNP